VPGFPTLFLLASFILGHRPQQPSFSLIFLQLLVFTLIMPATVFFSALKQLFSFAILQLASGQLPFSSPILP
jgi:hypothetical protein